MGKFVSTTSKSTNIESNWGFSKASDDAKKIRGLELNWKRILQSPGQLSSRWLRSAHVMYMVYKVHR